MKTENPQAVGGQLEGKQKKRSAFGEPRHVSEKTEIRRRIIRRIYFFSKFVFSILSMKES